MKEDKRLEMVEDEMAVDEGFVTDVMPLGVQS